MILSREARQAALALCNGGRGSADATPRHPCRIILGASSLAGKKLQDVFDHEVAANIGKPGQDHEPDCQPDPQGHGFAQPRLFHGKPPQPRHCRSNPLACDLTTVTERRGNAVHCDRDARCRGYLLRDLAWPAHRRQCDSNGAGLNRSRLTMKPWHGRWLLHANMSGELVAALHCVNGRNWKQSFCGSANCKD